MKSTATLFATCYAVLFACHALAQSQPVYTTGTADIGNIRATQLTAGAMWTDEINYAASCEFPKGSKKHINREGGIWMTAYDVNGLTHSAAAIHRSSNLIDYAPGPVNDTPAKWNAVWNVTRKNILFFIANPTSTIAQTYVKQWPAKGGKFRNLLSPNLSWSYVTIDMAPFTDVDHDGIYNIDNGDYPDIKGDKMLWNVFNDVKSHDLSNGFPLGVEVHASTYAYKRGTAIDNIVFYEYDLINKSSNTYYDFRFGIYADAQIGDNSDDYIGFDYPHRMAVTYNGTATDGNGQQGTYGSNTPVSGLTLLEQPGDGNNSYIPAGSFVSFQNNSSATGTPQNDIEYAYLMRGKNRDGSHLTVECGAQAGQITNYAYAGRPDDPQASSECGCNTTPGDRRYVLSTDGFIFPPGAHRKVAFALLVTDTAAYNSCPDISFDGISALADTAWQWYRYPHTILNVPGPALTQQALKIWPNPAQQTLFINTETDKESTVIAYDALGRTFGLSQNRKNNITELNISALPAGVYTLLFTTAHTRQSGIFIKQ